VRILPVRHSREYRENTVNVPFMVLRPACYHEIRFRRRDDAEAADGRIREVRCTRSPRTRIKRYVKAASPLRSAAQIRISLQPYVRPSDRASVAAAVASEMLISFPCSAIMALIADVLRASRAFLRAHAQDFPSRAINCPPRRWHGRLLNAPLVRHGETLHRRALGSLV